MKRDYRDHPRCQPLGETSGIGFQTATAFLAFIGDGTQFPAGSALGSWIGLTPRENSSDE